MIDINTLVNSDNEIFISKEYWKELNREYSKDEIKQAISDAIEVHNVELPYRKITKEECLSDFESLIKLNTKDLISYGKTFTRYDYKYPMNDWYIDLSNVGNKASDYFHQEVRWKADSINAPSPYRTWTTERFRLTLLNALWSLKFDEINMKNLRSAIGLRKYIAGQFRPSAAKAIYDIFGKNLALDPSAGWGDRLAGFYAHSANRTLTTLYEACDPNTSIDYRDQITSYKKITNKVPSIDMVPFEEKKLLVKEYDIVFTSPPYYNIEKYSKDEDQSYLKYKKFDDWLNWFLNEYIKKAWDSLKDKGYLIINISDVYSGHKVNHICDPMNDFISNLGGTYLGTIGLRMPKRPNSKADKEGIFVEPIWIWLKTNYIMRDNALDKHLSNYLTNNL